MAWLWRALECLADCRFQGVHTRDVRKSPLPEGVGRTDDEMFLSVYFNPGKRQFRFDTRTPGSRINTPIASMAALAPNRTTGFGNATA